MGSSCIDLSLSNVWQSYFKFKKGKKLSCELDEFNYYLEENLHKLYLDLNNGKYKHGKYRKFVVTDNKRREISVARIRDRVVHRLIYDHLNVIYDKSFIFDAWSCRKNKGLIGAIERAQKFLYQKPNAYVWRSDIKRFFDSVGQERLLDIVNRKIKDPKVFNLLREVIKSYKQAQNERERESKYAHKKGMPIGNLTSQIFANIYLNELDRFVKHNLKIKRYLRYGDDFIILADNLEELKKIRNIAINFLNINLHFEINEKNDIIIKARQGIKFLGVEIFFKGRRLNNRNSLRIKENLDFKNISSYSGLVKKYGNIKRRKEFNWIILDYYEKQI